MTLDRNTRLAIALVFASGWTASALCAAHAQPGRPVMRWMAKAAKNLLWVAVFVEPAPPEAEHRVMHARVDGEGVRLLDNGATL